MFTLPGILSSIKILITYSQAVIAESPWIYWEMNEQSGTTLLDSSGNNKVGLIENTNNIFNHYREAHLQTPKTLMLMSDNIAPHERVLCNSKLVNSSQFTIEFWWVKNFVNTSAALIGGVNNSDTWNLFLCPLNTQNKVLTLTINANSYALFEWNQGEVYHTVLVFNGINLSVYNNDILASTHTLNLNLGDLIISSPESIFYLGHGSTTTYNALAGVNNFAVYNTTLTLQQISDHYNLGKLWSPFNDIANVLAWYKEDIGWETYQDSTGGRLTSLYNISLPQGGAKTLNVHSTNHAYYGHYVNGPYIDMANNSHLVSTVPILPATSDFYIAIVLSVDTPIINNQRLVNQYNLRTTFNGRTTLTITRISSTDYWFTFFIGDNTQTVQPVLVVDSPVYSHNGHYYLVIARKGNNFKMYVNSNLVAETTDLATKSIFQGPLYYGALDYGTSGSTYSGMEEYATKIYLSELIIGSNLNSLSLLDEYIYIQYPHLLETNFLSTAKVQSHLNSTTNVQLLNANNVIQWNDFTSIDNTKTLFFDQDNIGSYIQGTSTGFLKRDVLFGPSNFAAWYLIFSVENEITNADEIQVIISQYDIRPSLNTSGRIYMSISKINNQFFRPRVFIGSTTSGLSSIVLEGPTYPINTHIFMAVVRVHNKDYDKSDQWKLYINGMLVSSWTDNNIVRDIQQTDCVIGALDVTDNSSIKYTTMSNYMTNVKLRECIYTLDSFSFQQAKNYVLNKYTDIFNMFDIGCDAWYKKNIGIETTTINSELRARRWNTEVFNNLNTSLISRNDSESVIAGEDSISQYITGRAGSFLYSPVPLVPLTNSFYLSVVFQVMTGTITANNDILDQRNLRIAGGANRLTLSVIRVTNTSFNILFFIQNSVGFPNLSLSASNYSNTTSPHFNVLVTRQTTRTNSTWSLFVNNVLINTIVENGVRSLQNTETMLLAADGGTSGSRFNNITFPSTLIRLRELVIGNAVNKRTEINAYLNEQFPTLNIF